MEELLDDIKAGETKEGRIPERLSILILPVFAIISAFLGPMLIIALVLVIILAF